MLQETTLTINESELLEMLCIYENRLDEKVRNYRKRTGKQIGMEEYAVKFRVAGWNTYKKLNSIWWKMNTDANYRLFEEL